MGRVFRVVPWLCNGLEAVVVQQQYQRRSWNRPLESRVIGERDVGTVDQSRTHRKGVGHAQAVGKQPCCAIGDGVREKARDPVRQALGLTYRFLPLTCQRPVMPGRTSSIPSPVPSVLPSSATTTCTSPGQSCCSRPTDLSSSGSPAASLKAGRTIYLLRPE